MRAITEFDMKNYLSIGILSPKKFNETICGQKHIKRKKEHFMRILCGETIKGGKIGA